MKGFLKTIALGTLFYSAIAFAAPVIWDGSADVSWYEESAQTYNLTTPEQLAGLAKLVNEGTSNFAGKTIALGADIFLNDTAGAGTGTWIEKAHRNWIPIGSENHPFGGEFDGLAGKMNHKIYGLYIESSSYYVGLFGYTKGLKISNVDVSVGFVSAKNFVGACVGYAFEGSITNVHTDAEVNGTDYVGGLAGDLQGSILKSSFVGDVTGRNNVGGIAGRVSNTISKSYASGTVNGSGNYVGGIAGASVHIDSSYHDRGHVGGAQYVGGLTGYAKGNISNSHSEGDVTGSDDYVGGLVGMLYCIYYGSGSQIWNVAQNSYSVGNVKGKNYVGGLIGLDSLYRQTDNTFVLSRIFKGVNTRGSIEGKSYVGGIVGKMNYGYRFSSDSSSSYYKSELDSCFHIDGNVIGTSYVGGLLGSNYGNVSNSYSKGDVVGNGSYVGGLLGSTYGSVLNSYSEGAIIGDSSYIGGIAGYITGAIDSAHHIGGLVRGFGYVGGLVGYINGSVSSSYSEGNVNGKGDYVGGLVGYGTDVQKSHVEGAVESESSYVGGIAGYAYGIIDSNYHVGGDVVGFSYVGGLFGYAASEIFNSYSEGNVEGLGDYVGGLAGLYFCLYEGSEPQTWYVAPNSYSIGNVKGENYVGGLIGLDSLYRDVNNTSVLTRIFKGVGVRGTVEGNSYVGGIVGKMNFGYRYSRASSSSYYNSIIDSCNHSDGNVNGVNYVGGLFGYTYGSVSNSYSKGNIIGLGNYVGGLIGSGGKIDSAYHMGGDVSGVRYVGGLAGYAGDVTNSYSEGSVFGLENYVGGLVGSGGKIDSAYHTGGDVSGVRYVGGLAGYAGNVMNSYSEGDVKGLGNYIGGLVGWSSLISKCHVSGSVKGDSNYVGGIGGSVTSKIDSVYHTGGDVSGMGYVGGVVGISANAISNSRSEGKVAGRKDYVGGIVGRASGEIDSVVHIGGVNGLSYVGGLAGYAAGKLSNSNSSGKVIGVGEYVGGLVGLYYCRYNGSSAQTWIVAENSSFTGNVKGGNYVGGLIGLDSIYRDVENTYVLTRNFKGSNMRGSVEGLSYVGGIVGKMNYGYQYSPDSSSSSGSYYKSELDSCYHVGGNVIGTSYVGGLSGFVYGNVSNSYSEGNVIGNGNYVGGLIGYGKYKVKGSYVKGSVASNSDYVGGLVGYIGGTKGYVNYGVDSSYHIGGGVSGHGYVGGLVGYATSDVRKSQSEGNVTGSGKYIGGLVGFGGNEMTVSSCDVSGTISSDSSYVGGMIGYATGGVVNSNHVGGDIFGHSYVGGLTGYQVRDVYNSRSEGNVVATGGYVGGLVGYTAGDVSDSYSEGNVTAAGDYVGGLVGVFYRECNTANQTVWNIAANSYSSGNVKGGSYVGGLIGLDSIYFSYQNYFSGVLTRRINDVVLQGSVEGKSYVGGVVGKMNYGYKSTSFASRSYYKSELISCQHTNGDVVGTNYVGGLVGYTYGSILDSYSDGNIVGDSSYIGGLAGIAGNINFSYHIGEKVIGLNYVGGVAGAASGIRNSYATMSFVTGQKIVGGLSGATSDSVYSSYFEGDSVMGHSEVGGLVGRTRSAVVRSYSTANVKGSDNVGGLVGSAYWHISASYALGNVIGDENNSSAGNDNMGGLVGYQYEGSITNSMAIGNVFGTTKLGGLVGRFEGNSILQSYANGDVTGNYYGNPADEIGNYYIGGLVGYGKGSIAESYTSGTAQGIKDNPVYTGCIVGYVNVSLNVSSSYYDKTKCSLGVDGGENMASVLGNPGKTTTEMQDQTTYEDWDFANTWQIVNQSYPFLQIYANSLTNAVVTTESLEGLVYDGLPKTPQVLTVSLFGNVLTQGVDYSVKYLNNKDAGTARISICGYYPYGGCKNIQFEIIPLVVEPTVTFVEHAVYTGYPLTPKISVYNGEKPLAITEYVVEYENNVNVGSASVSVVLKGNYSGAVTKAFTIEKAKPIISQIPVAIDVANGQTLMSSDLVEGSANVEGRFVWKIPLTVPVLGNEGYDVVFIPADTANYDFVEIAVPVNVREATSVVVRVADVVIDSAVVVKGDVFTLPVVPDSAGYDFSGFFQGDSVVGFSGDVVSVSENTVIDAKYSIKIFAVNFVNDGTELQSDSLPYGSLPEYIGSTPIKAASAKYTYTFKGWNPVIETASKSATYTAVFDSVVNKYIITFVDGNTVLQSNEVEYGTMPTPPTVSLPENTAQYIYSFGGWDKEIATVTGTATYSAVINQIVNKYSVVFKDYNGTILKNSVKYNYGTSVADIVKPANPIRNSTAQYAYSFKGWNPVVSDVTDNAEYVAEYDSTLRNYTIAFVNGSETLQSTNIDYGLTPVYKGKTPTRVASDQYTYTFKGWSPTITTVTGSATYKAVFDSSVQKYTVVFRNGNDKLQTISVAYGETPKYTGKTPTKKSTNGYSFEFIGWSPKLGPITKEIEFVAVFDSTKVTGIQNIRLAGSKVSVNAVARNIQISAAPVGSAYAIFDMQGRVLKNGVCHSANFNIPFLHPGKYLVRVGAEIESVQIK